MELYRKVPSAERTRLYRMFDDMKRRILWTMQDEMEAELKREKNADVNAKHSCSRRDE